MQGIKKDERGQVTELTGELHLEGSVKATKLKLTWLPQVCSHSRLLLQEPIPKPRMMCGGSHTGQANIPGDAET